MRRQLTAVGGLVLACVAGMAILAPLVAPHDPNHMFHGLLNAPPTAIHLRDANGAWHRPFVHPLVLVNQLEQRYLADETARVPIAFFANGRLMQSSDDARAPLLVLGADSFGRDVFGRLLAGARVSLSLAVAAAIVALALGAFVGGVAGYAGGSVDDILMRASDFIVILPTIYVVLALRSVLPLVLGARAVFLLLGGIFAVVGAPLVARGVRAIVRAERHMDYASAAESLGASRIRVLVRHLLPAAAGFLAVQITMLVPAFIVAEATLSYVGLGFPDTTATWGTMLHDATNVRVFADFPWLLSPAAAIFLVVLALNLFVEGGASSASFASSLSYNSRDDARRGARAGSDAV